MALRLVAKSLQVSTYGVHILFISYIDEGHFRWCEIPFQNNNWYIIWTKEHHIQIIITVLLLSNRTAFNKGKIWLYDPSYKIFIPDAGRILNKGRLSIFLFSNFVKEKNVKLNASSGFEPLICRSVTAAEQIAHAKRKSITKL